MQLNFGPFPRRMWTKVTRKTWTNQMRTRQIQPPPHNHHHTVLAVLEAQSLPPLLLWQQLPVVGVLVWRVALVSVQQEANRSTQALG